MKVINLRDIYPHYTQDCFIEVTDEVADLFRVRPQRGGLPSAYIPAQGVLLP